MERTARTLTLFFIAAIGLGTAGCGGDATPETDGPAPGNTEETSGEPEGPTPAAAEAANAVADEAEAPAGPATPEEPEEPEDPEVREVDATVSQGEGTDLLHTVQSVVAADTVYRNDLSQIARLFDGDMETAWNSQTLAPGATASQSLTVTLPDDVQVEAIELNAGYNKVSRGNDLFTSNLRLRRVRVHHEGQITNATLNIAERGLQRIPVSGGGGEWRIELVEWEPGSRADWRELCISELRVVGTAGANAPSGTTPTTRLGAAQAEAIAAGDAVPGEDTQHALGAIETPQRPGAVSLGELVLAPEMSGVTPVEPSRHYNKLEHERIYCFFRLENPTEEATNVTLGWEDANGQSRREPTEIDVPARRRFRHYRYTSTSWRRPGTYSCVVRDAAGEEIGRIPFQLAGE